MGLRADHESSPSCGVRTRAELGGSSGASAGTTIRGTPAIVPTTLAYTSGELHATPLLRVAHDVPVPVLQPVAP